MDLVSYLEWLYRQDLVKIHHGLLPFLGCHSPGFAYIRESLLALHGFVDNSGGCTFTDLSSGIFAYRCASLLP